jgi:hypothetical protein
MKFTPIEEKERIGKRRKLSREDEVRNTAMAKHATSFIRISSHANRPQSGGGLHKGTDWNLKIHISSPKTMRRAQEYSESPIRSMSSDTMLSGFGGEDERDMFPGQSEDISHTPSNMEYEPISDNLAHPDSQTYRAQNFDTSSQKISAEITETEVRIRSSPIPVLHRFTLDDQVLAERLANSQMEAESPGSHPSNHYSAMLSHKHHDTFHNETLLGSSPRIQSEDRHTTISGSHKSYPTDSDTLPQMQKIQRQLPPSQSQMARSIFSEAQFKTSRVTSRLLTRPESVVNTKEPMTLFGQKVHSLSPEPSDKKAKSTTSERPFPSNMHGYHMASPHVQPVSTPRAVHQTPVLEFVTGTRPTSGVRFPNLWTPHRAIPQLSSYDEIHQKVDLTTSPIVSHRRPSPFISSLSQGNYRARQPPNLARSSLSKIVDDSNTIDGYDESIHAPVFNTPFRR